MTQSFSLNFLKCVPLFSILPLSQYISAPFIPCIFSCNHHFSLLMMLFKTCLSSCLHQTRAIEAFLPFATVYLCVCACLWILPQGTVTQQCCCGWFFFIIFIFYWRAELGCILWHEKARDLRDSCIKLRLCLVWSFCIKYIKQSISWS